MSASAEFQSKHAIKNHKIKGRGKAVSRLLIFIFQKLYQYLVPELAKLQSKTLGC